MNTTTALAFLALVVSALSWSCSADKEGATSVRGAAGGAAGAPPTAVVGTVALEAADAAGAAVEGRVVQLVDSDNVVVSEGKTTAAGAFTIALETAALNLAAGNNSGRVLSLRSLFLNGEAQPSAVGLRQQIAIPSASATANFDVGTQTAKKVGAIVGRVTLETGADPTGIDVYVPGTTHIAKTDGTGLFVLGFLPPGNYDLRADKDGFASFAWQDLVVAQGRTTHVGDTALRISTGPSVTAFALAQGGAVTFTTNVTLKIALSGAAKYRVSQLNDFRDAVYRAFDVKKPELSVPFVVSGRDGLQPIYLEAADNDGLVAKATLDVLLDTAPPSVPTYVVSSAGARDGYSNVTTPKLTVAHCDDIAKVLVTEDTAKTPVASEFTVDCSLALAGATIAISGGEGAKELRLWTLDAAGQVSKQSRAYAMRLDSVAPTLSVSPNDTAPFPAAIRITATTDTEAEVHYTTDLSTPTLTSPQVLGELALFNDATFKLKAIDFAGNESAVVQRAYQIDRDGPILGTIAATDADGVVASRNVSLRVSAIGATKVGFTADRDDTKNVTFSRYDGGDQTYSFAVPGTSDGDYTIYAVFSDDAGHAIGLNAEIGTRVTIDTTRPTAARIALLTPASPSGDFDKRLVWASTLEDVEYEVNICTDVSCNTIIRQPTVSDLSMRTAAKSVVVSPSLDTPGVYYWRVRAVDLAGNFSDWVSSGQEYKFELRILASAFTARRTYRGKSRVAQNHMMNDRFYGRAFAPLGDWSGDGKTDVAISIGEAADEFFGTSASVNLQTYCDRCPAIAVRDIAGKSEIARVTAPPTADIPPHWNRQSLFGKGMVACDVIDGDGVKELVVSAPAQAVRSGTVTYYNYGAIYVYEWKNSRLELATTYVPPTTNKSYAYQDVNCATGNGCPTTAGPGDRVIATQWLDLSLPFGNAAAIMKSGPYTGWALACEAQAGGDLLWASEPGHASTGDQKQYGRVLQLDYAAGALAPTANTLVGPAAEKGFGAALLYMPDFDHGACNGAVLAVGAPKGQPGAVYLYEKSGASWVNCATINGEATDPMFSGFGAVLADLGNANADVGNLKELAVGAPGLTGTSYTCGESGGFIRVFGDDGALVSHAYLNCTGPDASYRFGFHIARGGDLSGDGASDILVTAPNGFANGASSTGIAHFLRWSDLKANATGGVAATPFKIVKGPPQNFGYFGTAAHVEPAIAGYGAEPQYVLFGRPGQTLVQQGPPENQDFCSSTTLYGAYFPSGAAGNGGPRVHFPCHGAAEEFAAGSLKIGEPERKVGNVAGAGFGRAIQPLPDMDGDQIGDLAISAPAGRCNGLNFGSLVVLSGADNSEIRQVCGHRPGSRFGDWLGHLKSSPPSHRFIGFSYVDHDANLYIGARRGVPPFQVGNESLLDSFSWIAPPMPGYTPLNTAGPTHEVPGDGALVSPVRTFGGAGNVQDYFTIMQPAAQVGLGVVHLVRLFQGDTSFNGPSGYRVRVAGTGGGINDQFGTSADVGSHLQSGGIVMPYDVFGAPGVPRIYVCRHFMDSGSAHTTRDIGNCDVAGAAFPDTIKAVSRNPAADKTNFEMRRRDGTTSLFPAGETIQDGFGSLVVALPDLDGADSAGTPTYDAFVFVANTNAQRDPDDTATGQYFILGINIEGATPVDATTTEVDMIKVLHASTDSEAGTLLGGAAHLIPDIDGDDVQDLVVASPKGTGTYGKTGHVRFLSLKKLIQTPGDESDDLIQVVFNPDSAANNFGISAVRADYNGDGALDVLIGADRYSSDATSNAGAVYFFPLEGVKR